MRLAATKYRYTHLELRVLATLSKRRRNTLEITELVYSPEFNKKFGPRKRPRYARVAVRSCLEGLKQKLKDNHEDFRIVKSRQRGPRPINYWLKDKALPAASAQDDQPKTFVI